MKQALSLGVAAVALAAIALAPARPQAQQVKIGDHDLGGVVTSANGPEAGVWVIAETTDLPTKFAKIVVTDDQGRYVVPDLPQANYSVWVRGYGLVDSAKTKTAPGKIVNLTAVPAPNAAAAAQYYPAIYWYSMLKIPDASQFGGKSEIPEKVTQQEWLTTIKNRACVGCHQLGQLATRTIPAVFTAEFKDSDEAWMRRVQSGQAAPLMVGTARRHARRRAVPLFRRLDRPRRQGRAAACASRRGRRGSSATSSSPPGHGGPRAPICMT